MGKRKVSKKLSERIKWGKVIRSKTLWVNTTALVALIAQTSTGFIFAPVEQASVIVVANLLLRVVTNEGLIEE